MSRIAIPAAVLGLVAAAFFIPFVLRDHDLVASTPSPRPLFDVTPLDLPQGEPLCIHNVTIPRNARQLRLQVITGGAPGPQLDITLGRQRVTVPAGYADETTLSQPIQPPPTATLATVCITRRGDVPAALTATTEERTQSRPQAVIDGRPVKPDAYLAFYEGRTGTPLANSADIVDRMSAFRPGIVGPWLLWPLLALVLLGVPTGLIWAIGRAAP
jgi:hypothetical protein